MLFVPSDCVKFPCWCCTKVTVVYLYSVYSRGCILIGRCLRVKEGYKRSGSSTGTQEQSAHNEQKHRHSKQKKPWNGEWWNYAHWSLVSLERKHIDWSWSNWFCSGRSRTIGSGFFWEWADVSSRLNTARGGGLVPPMSSVRMYSSTSRALWVPPL